MKQILNVSITFSCTRYEDGNAVDIKPTRTYEDLGDMPLIFIDRVTISLKRNLRRVGEADKHPRLEEFDFDDQDQVDEDQVDEYQENRDQEDGGFNDRDEEQRVDHRQMDPNTEGGAHSDAETTDLIYAAYPHMHFCQGVFYVFDWQNGSLQNGSIRSLSDETSIWTDIIHLHILIKTWL